MIGTRLSMRGLFVSALFAVFTVAACEQVFQGPHRDETPTVQVRNGPAQEPTEVKVTDKQTGDVLIDKTVGETNAIGSMPRRTGGTLIVEFKKEDGTPVQVEVAVPSRRHVVITVDNTFGTARITEETSFGRGTLGGDIGTAGD